MYLLSNLRMASDTFSSTQIINTSVAGIIDRFQLRRPLYLQTAAYGHFGKPDLPWEEVIG